jgi:hypothetical protein
MPGLTLALERSSHGCELHRSEHDDGLQLPRQLVGREVALEDAVLRTVEQPPQLPRLSLPAGPPGVPNPGNSQLLGARTSFGTAQGLARGVYAGDRLPPIWRAACSGHDRADRLASSTTTTRPRRYTFPGPIKAGPREISPDESR